ncbi:MFS transporter [Leifsonia sp. Root1293]|uniref:MFS transporter n=1 Tax=Leifsonia sp. Root1293 TaxID=1736446 RepID=UPI000700DFED|nr:MFS transporter [Leifsonia sp. Root1293]KQX05554.1 Puromycin resistance protein pur8 [Leifsonia sp. Root1293]KRA09188.1 Puromycin resistance protein pur8 [Leifsonia sp. Root60]
MSSSSSSSSTSRRWWVLVTLALTQLIVVLDGTIVNMALPQAQQELGLTDSERQWVVTGYALAFGALLLLGGRIADYWGRKRAYLVGMVGFGIASVIGGIAQNGTELILARGLQGVFAALMAPAALALLTMTFPSGRDRNRAFAVFGAVAGAGAGVGMLLGGLLTEAADWRWCLLVNVPVVVIAFIAGAILVTESRAEGENRYDIPGVITVTLGLGSLVYGFTLAEESWTSVGTVGFIAAGVVLLAAFVWIESRVGQPLLPLRIVLDRVRGGAFLLQAIAGSVMIGAMVFLTFHLQIVLGLSPLVAGFATLPLPVVISLCAPLATKVLSTWGPRPLMIGGTLVAAAGLGYLSLITVDGSYVVQVLPALVLLGIGMAMLFIPMQNLALAGVAPHDAGAASATANAAMQIGGSIGLSIFATAYASAIRDASVPGSMDALVDGYSAAFLSAAIAMLVGTVIAIALIRRPKLQAATDAASDASSVDDEAPTGSVPVTSGR